MTMNLKRFFLALHTMVCAVSAAYCMMLASTAPADLQAGIFVIGSLLGVLTTISLAKLTEHT